MGEERITYTPSLSEEEIGVIMLASKTVIDSTEAVLKDLKHIETLEEFKRPIKYHNNFEALQDDIDDCIYILDNLKSGFDKLHEILPKEESETDPMNQL